MKAKYILLSILCLSIGTTTEAQILKKLTKKAEQAAERTILNKTDEAVSQKTGEVIDKTVSGGNNETTNSDNGTPSQETPQNENAETPQNPEQQNAKMEKMATMFGGGLEDVPDSYIFSYVLTYQIKTNKDEMPFSYYLDPGAPYLGNQTEDPRGNSFMVYDFKKNFMITFMDNGQQKMAMKMKMPNMKKMQQRYGEQLLMDDQDEDAQIIPIEGKNILGYDCLGYKIINKEGESKIWFTNDAPVSPNAVFAKLKKMPEKGPRANIPLSENTLIMEVDFQSSKTKKDNMHMVCTELVEKSFIIEKKDYKTGM